MVLVGLALAGVMIWQSEGHAPFVVTGKLAMRVLASSKDDARIVELARTSGSEVIDDGRAVAVWVPLSRCADVRETARGEMVTRAGGDGATQVLVLLGPHGIGPEDLSGAAAYPDQGRYGELMFLVRPERQVRKRLLTLTSRHTGRHVAIVANGEACWVVQVMAPIESFVIPARCAEWVIDPVEQAG